MTGVQTCALPICFPVTIIEPIEFEAFGFGKKTNNEIHVIRDYAFGQFYLANPQYLAALPYIQLENELSNYFVNHVKNGFSAGHVINMNMQEPDDEMKAKIVTILNVN